MDWNTCCLAICRAKE